MANYTAWKVRQPRLYPRAQHCPHMWHWASHFSSSTSMFPLLWSGSPHVVVRIKWDTEKMAYRLCHIAREGKPQEGLPVAFLPMPLQLMVPLQGALQQNWRAAATSTPPLSFCWGCFTKRNSWKQEKKPMASDYFKMWCHQNLLIHVSPKMPYIISVESRIQDTACWNFFLKKNLKMLPR